MFWTLLLIAADIPTQVRISAQAEKTVRLPLVTITSGGLLDPANPANAATIRDVLQARTRVDDTLKLSFSGFSGGSLLTLLAPFLSGVLPGLGGKGEGGG